MHLIGGILRTLAYRSVLVSQEYLKGEIVGVLFEAKGHISGCFQRHYRGKTAG